MKHNRNHLHLGRLSLCKLQIIARVVINKYTKAIARGGTMVAAEGGEISNFDDSGSLENALIGANFCTFTIQPYS